MLSPSRRAAVAAATLALVSWLAPQALASRGSDPDPDPGPVVPGIIEDLPDVVEEVPGPDGLPPVGGDAPDVPGTDPPDVPGTELPELPGIELPEVPETGLPEVPGGGSGPLGLDVLLSVSLSGSITLL